MDYGVFLPSNSSSRMNLCPEALNKAFESLNQVSELRTSTTFPQTPHRCYHPRVLIPRLASPTIYWCLFREVNKHDGCQGHTGLWCSCYSWHWGWLPVSGCLTRAFGMPTFLLHPFRLNSKIAGNSAALSWIGGCRWVAAILRYKQTTKAAVAFSSYSSKIVLLICYIPHLGVASVSLTRGNLSRVCVCVCVCECIHTSIPKPYQTSKSPSRKSLARNYPSHPSLERKAILWNLPPSNS